MKQQELDLSQYARLTRIYIEKCIHDTKDNFGQILGVANDYLTENLSIEDSRLSFVDAPDSNDPWNLACSDLLIKGIHYIRV